MRHTLSTRTRRCRRQCLGTAGAAAVELAITISLLAVLMLGIADYGVLMNNAAGLIGASRAGAEYAVATNSTDTTGTKNQVCGFYGVSGTSCSPVTPGATAVCTCVDNTSVTCPTAGSGSAGGPCAGTTNPYTNLTDTRVLEYMDVTATQTFSPLFTVSNFGALSKTTFSFPTSLTGTTVARTQ